MAEKLKFELISPEKVVMSEQVDMVSVPGTEGEFGVFAGHAPVMTGIRPGMVDVIVDDKTNRRIFVRGGFAEITAQGLTILSEEAIPIEELNRDMMGQQIKNAEEDLTDAKDDAAKQKAQETLDHLREIERAISN